MLSNYKINMENYLMKIKSIIVKYNFRLEAIPLTTHYGTNNILGYISTGKTVSDDKIVSEVE